MTPERMAEIREHNEWLASRHKFGNPAGNAEKVNDLLEYVDELTRQRDDARAMVVQSRFFQNTEAEWYEPSYPGDHMPDVGPVAWNRQVQQT
jgi:hypothetical protein